MKTTVKNYENAVLSKIYNLIKDDIKTTGTTSLPKVLSLSDYNRILDKFNNK